MSFELFSLENIQEFAQSYGYWAIFLGILLENLGIPLPGETVTLVGGFLAGSDELNYWLVLGDAVTGAVIGGTFGYWIGRVGGWPFLLQVGKIFRISETRLLSIKDQFSENAAKAVFFGRFFALLRIFAAPLAGIAEMSFGKFLVYNLAGASAWAGVMVTLAFFAGRIVSLEQLVAWVSQFAILALLILVAVIVVPIWWESRQVKHLGE
ncbi:MULTISPECIES: DedA family protein [Sphaerospermopsis]|jgi:membrane protein DedA with SNARE-associated domain|uniref:DedA family protein n=2 Tax=Sphaerospermopsis TaxID=752201 RepID=A0ABT4ZW58_9CYAN|nr:MULTISPECIES: DedA family protein [Sphaerospermopsis]BAZ81255.1 SNARE associated Golgi protein-like protein [Sphaerospermopsis kisseleviana NIES-73]MBD2135952.1 DedA family protein [Sphaerospermopsis sp. FACHB-1094]MBD2148429.1 DedA family protein [Sphaerospermopsis sp. FACHB-1194]MBE9059062.1 DedA family protein [Sphaerospermopsis sp. LEGE 08334]MDB9442988.1 DedA family protein [Sphaerospermopsis kisseleviana CS-549]